MIRLAQEYYLLDNEFDYHDAISLLLHLTFLLQQDVPIYNGIRMSCKHDRNSFQILLNYSYPIEYLSNLHLQSNRFYCNYQNHYQNHYYIDQLLHGHIDEYQH